MSDFISNKVLPDKNDIKKTNEIVAHQEIYAKINKEEKKLQPFLTKYERARLIGTRARQLSSGASAMIDTTNFKNVVEVAEEELKQRVIPFIVRRYLSNGKYEDWKIDEFKII